ncbi:hypothetical protein [Actinotalea sp.]|uniref:HAAS signaling domain-containing protein n=1 Tax=Actinotalea sp. TaxID=1872145 RepID=UPI003566B488
MIDSRPGSGLLDAYLADLERRLAAADPGERADIVASVREHVEADLSALGRPATSADVQASLATLGSVDTVVAAWAPDGVASSALTQVGTGAVGGPDLGPAPGWSPAGGWAAPPPAAAPRPTEPFSRREVLLLTLALVAVVALALAYPLAWLLLPPALLVFGVVGARRHPGRRAPYVVTAVVAGVLLSLSLLVAPLLSLVIVGSGSVEEGPTMQVEPADPTD